MLPHPEGQDHPIRHPGTVAIGPILVLVSKPAEHASRHLVHETVARFERDDSCRMADPQGTHAEAEVEDVAFRPSTCRPVTPV